MAANTKGPAREYRVRGRMTDFGLWLDRQLRNREWSNKAFAEMINVSPSTVSKWLYADTPTPQSCDLIAEALMVPLDTVLDQAGHRRRTEAVGDEVREEAIQLINRIPEPYLVALLPALRGMTAPGAQQRSAELIYRFARERTEAYDADPDAYDDEVADAVTTMKRAG